MFEAFNYGETEPLVVVIDAKREQVWMQVFDAVSHEPGAISVQQAVSAIPEHISRLTGSGAPLIVNQSPRFVVIGSEASPSITAVAIVAESKISTGSMPKPLYLRQPDAKPQNLAPMSA